MKSIIISIIVVFVLIGGALFFVTQNNGGDSPQGSVNNVSVVDGKQIIEIDAKGGYSPQITSAKADIETIIKVNTKGTFDCSAALTIPTLNYRTTLQPSGVTEIEVPPQKVGTTLQGLCGMGMYNFKVQFN